MLLVMFEKYQCAGVYIAIQAVLTLYAQGKSHDPTLRSHDLIRTTWCCLASCHDAMFVPILLSPYPHMYVP